MRSMSAPALSALNLKNPQFFLLAKLQATSVNKFYSSLSGTVVFNGDTYLKGSAVSGFGPPRVSSSVDREIYELIVSDVDNSIQELARSGITGSQLTVYAGFFGSDGYPLLNVEDVIVAYQGRIDNVVIINDFETKLAKLQAASPMANLDATGGYIASRDGQDQAAPGVNDTCFDEIYAGSKTVTLKWGKT